MNGRARFLAATAGAAVDATPAWFMRQAGGSLPRYLELRASHDVLEIAHTPSLCAEVSLAAAETLGTDGAVMFADIMLLVEAMGVAVRLTETGPVIDAPLRDAAAIERLRDIDARSDLGFVLEAIKLVRSGIDGRAAVIGLIGGPFTLAAYLIDGGPTREQYGPRVSMHRDPQSWFGLVDRIATASIAFGRAQAAAGADVIQVFDTWAASLTAHEYDRFVAPATKRILAGLPVPTILSVARCRPLLASIARVGATVVAIDSRQSLASVRQALGADRAVQGNLDPVRLLVGSESARDGADEVLAGAGPRGHIFGTGEPQIRETDPEVLRDLVKHVHDRSAGMH